MPPCSSELLFLTIVWTLLPERGFLLSVNRGHASNGNYPGMKEQLWGWGEGSHNLGPLPTLRGANYSGTEAG